MKKKAYVLIKVSAGKLDQVMRTLSEMPQVMSAEGVSGNCDVVAVVRGPDLETLQDTILSTMRSVDGIESTETWIVMVAQPDTWTRSELDRYVSSCNEVELLALKVMLEKRRPMMVQELIEELSEHLEDDDYDIQMLTVSLTSMAVRSQEEFRREHFIVFDQDVGYFIDERYPEMLERAIASVTGLS